MDWINTHIFFLVSTIILLVAYMVYLSQRKNLKILKSPPVTQRLPRNKYDTALRELNQLKNLPLPSSQRARIERNSKQYVLERYLQQVLRETEEEQQAYYMACKECEVAWKNFRDQFNSMNFFERIFSFNKTHEIHVLRQLYLSSVERVDLEVAKARAKSRIKKNESERVGAFSQEVERGVQNNLSAQGMESGGVEEGEAARPLEKGGFRVSVLDDSPRDSDAHQDTDEEILTKNEMLDVEAVNMNEEISNQESRNEILITAESPEPPNEAEGHFSQTTFSSIYPDFRAKTYIDDTFSFVELGEERVIDANFDKSFFVQVLFEGTHQYRNCSFVGADFSFSVWQRSDSPHRVLDCDFSFSNFSNAKLEFMAFYNCEFVETIFSEATLHMVKFVNCLFENCDIDGVDFSKTVMSAEMLEQIDFSPCASPPKNAKISPPKSPDHSPEGVKEETKEEDQAS